MNSAAVNILVHVFSGWMYAFLSSICLEVKLLGHRVCICSVFTDAAKQFAIVVASAYVPEKHMWLPHILATLGNFFFILVIMVGMTLQF